MKQATDISSVAATPISSFTMRKATASVPVSEASTTAAGERISLHAASLLADMARTQNEKNIEPQSVSKCDMPSDAAYSHSAGLPAVASQPHVDKELRGHHGSDVERSEKDDTGVHDEEPGAEYDPRFVGRMNSNDIFEAYSSFSAWKWKSMISRRSAMYPMVYAFLVFAWMDRLLVYNKGYDWLAEKELQLRYEIAQNYPALLFTWGNVTQLPAEAMSPLPMWEVVALKPGFEPIVMGSRFMVPQCFTAEKALAFIFVLVHLACVLHLILFNRAHHMSKSLMYFTFTSFSVLKVVSVYDFHVHNLVGVIERTASIFGILMGSAMFHNMGGSVFICALNSVIDFILIGFQVLAGYTHSYCILGIFGTTTHVMGFLTLSHDFEMFRRYNHLRLEKTPNWVLRSDMVTFLNGLIAHLNGLVGIFQAKRSGEGGLQSSSNAVLKRTDSSSSHMSDEVGDSSTTKVDRKPSKPSLYRKLAPGETAEPTLSIGVSQAASTVPTHTPINFWNQLLFIMQESLCTCESLNLGVNAARNEDTIPTVYPEPPSVAHIGSSQSVGTHSSESGEVKFPTAADEDTHSRASKVSRLSKSRDDDDRSVMQDDRRVFEGPEPPFTPLQPKVNGLGQLEIPRKVAGVFKEFAGINVSLSAKTSNNNAYTAQSEVSFEDLLLETFSWIECLYGSSLPLYLLDGVNEDMRKVFGPHVHHLLYIRENTEVLKIIMFQLVRQGIRQSHTRGIISVSMELIADGKGSGEPTDELDDVIPDAKLSAKKRRGQCFQLTFQETVPYQSPDGWKALLMFLYKELLTIVFGSENLKGNQDVRTYRDSADLSFQKNRNRIQTSFEPVTLFVRHLVFILEEIFKSMQQIIFQLRMQFSGLFRGSKRTGEDLEPCKHRMTSSSMSANNFTEAEGPYGTTSPRSDSLREEDSNELKLDSPSDQMSKTPISASGMYTSRSTSSSAISVDGAPGVQSWISSANARPKALDPIADRSKNKLTSGGGIYLGGHTTSVECDQEHDQRLEIEAKKTWKNMTTDLGSLGLENGDELLPNSMKFLLSDESMIDSRCPISSLADRIIQRHLSFGKGLTFYEPSYELPGFKVLRKSIVIPTDKIDFLRMATDSPSNLQSEISEVQAAERNENSSEVTGSDGSTGRTGNRRSNTACDSNSEKLFWPACYDEITTTVTDGEGNVLSTTTQRDFTPRADKTPSRTEDTSSYGTSRTSQRHHRRDSNDSSGSSDRYSSTSSDDKNVEHRYFNRFHSWIWIDEKPSIDAEYTSPDASTADSWASRVYRATEALISGTGLFQLKAQATFEDAQRFFHATGIPLTRCTLPELLKRYRVSTFAEIISTSTHPNNMTALKKTAADLDQGQLAANEAADVVMATTDNATIEKETFTTVTTTRHYTEYDTLAVAKLSFLVPDWTTERLSSEQQLRRTTELQQAFALLHITPANQVVVVSTNTKQTSEQIYSFTRNLIGSRQESYSSEGSEKSFDEIELTPLVLSRGNSTLDNAAISNPSGSMSRHNTFRQFENAESPSSRSGSDRQPSSSTMPACSLELGLLPPMPTVPLRVKDVICPSRGLEEFFTMIVDHQYIKTSTQKGATERNEKWILRSSLDAAFTERGADLLRGKDSSAPVGSAKGSNITGVGYTRGEAELLEGTSGSADDTGFEGASFYFKPKFWESKGMFWQPLGHSESPSGPSLSALKTAYAEYLVKPKPQEAPSMPASPTFALAIKPEPIAAEPRLPENNTTLAAATASRAKPQHVPFVEGHHAVAVGLSADLNPATKHQSVVKTDAVLQPVDNSPRTASDLTSNSLSLSADEPGLSS